MQVVLLERIEKLGQMGDVVRVKDGYARNFLLPRRKVLRATKENLARFEQERAQLEAHNLERRQDAEVVAERLQGNQFTIIRQAGETGQLYGSVTARDLVEIINQNGFTIIRDQVALDRPVKSLGLHEAVVRLHPEVRVSVTMNVARNEEEAVRQARGLAINADGEEEADDQGDVDLGEVFEDEELARRAVETARETQETEDGETAAPDQPGDAPAEPQPSEKQA